MGNGHRTRGRNGEICEVHLHNYTVRVLCRGVDGKRNRRDKLRNGKEKARQQKGEYRKGKEGFDSVWW